MSANALALRSLSAGPALVPSIRETLSLVDEAGDQAVQGSESVRFAEGFLRAIDFEVTAIDFEVAAARCLYGVWHEQRHGDVYLIRTVERIAEHLKALQAIQAKLIRSGDGSTPAELHPGNRGGRSDPASIRS